jgi:hypothetical protein
LPPSYHECHHRHHPTLLLLRNVNSVCVTAITPRRWHALRRYRLVSRERGGRRSPIAPGGHHRTAARRSQRPPIIAAFRTAVPDGVEVVHSAYHPLASSTLSPRRRWVTHPPSSPPPPVFVSRFILYFGQGVRIGRLVTCELLVHILVLHLLYYTVLLIDFFDDSVKNSTSTQRPNVDVF